MSIGRRSLELHDFSEVEREVKSLAETGYQMVGNWTLGQACRHLSLDLQSSMDGYPVWTYMLAPVRPLIRKFFLPKLLRFESPDGVRTMGRYVPPAGMSDESGTQEYLSEIQRFRSFDGPFRTHPGFGFNDAMNLERVYSAHASHHLSFLIPNVDRPVSA